MDIRGALAENARAVNEVLDVLLPMDSDPEARLWEAIRYAALSGGKRIRPFLVVSGAALFDVEPARALRVAAAIEMVHCYSLIHDDLPAMDNDDLRRGLPTCHVKFDEATAILAGDALLTRSFEVIAHPNTHADARVRCDLVLELARAAGPEGMVAGQMLDLMAEHKSLKEEEVTRLQRLKTGALIRFSCVAGAILGQVSLAQRLPLQAYAHDLGLAFQIVDDVLDYEGTEAELGKKTHKDGAAGKASFVTLLGLEGAKGQALMLADQAVQHLEVFDERADPLRALARFVVDRRT